MDGAKQEPLGYCRCHATRLNGRPRRYWTIVLSLFLDDDEMLMIITISTTATATPTPTPMPSTSANATSTTSNCYS